MFQLWQIIGMDFALQQTPKTPRQRSSTIPPGICQVIPWSKNRPLNAHSHVRSYTPQTWQVQPRECQQTHSRKQKAQKAQRCCRETVWRNDKMFHTSGGSEIPCQFISMIKADQPQPDLHSVHPTKLLLGTHQKGTVLPEREADTLCINHRVYQPPCN